MSAQGNAPAPATNASLSLANSNGDDGVYGDSKAPAVWDVSVVDASTQDASWGEEEMDPADADAYEERMTKMRTQTTLPDNAPVLGNQRSDTKNQPRRGDRPLKTNAVSARDKRNRNKFNLAQTISVVEPSVLAPKAAKKEGELFFKRFAEYLPEILSGMRTPNPIKPFLERVFQAIGTEPSDEVAQFTSDVQYFQYVSDLIDMDDAAVFVKTLGTKNFEDLSALVAGNRHGSSLSDLSAANLRVLSGIPATIKFIAAALNYPGTGDLGAEVRRGTHGSSLINSLVFLVVKKGLWTKFPDTRNANPARIGVNLILEVFGGSSFRYIDNSQLKMRMVKEDVDRTLTVWRQLLSGTLSLQEFGNRKDRFPLMNTIAGEMILNPQDLSLNVAQAALSKHGLLPFSVFWGDISGRCNMALYQLTIAITTRHLTEANGFKGQEAGDVEFIRNKSLDYRVPKIIVEQERAETRNAMMDHFFNTTRNLAIFGAQLYPFGTRADVEVDAFNVKEFTLGDALKAAPMIARYAVATILSVKAFLRAPGSPYISDDPNIEIKLINNAIDLMTDALRQLFVGYFNNPENVTVASYALSPYSDQRGPFHEYIEDMSAFVTGKPDIVTVFATNGTPYNTLNTASSQTCLFGDKCSSGDEKVPQRVCVVKDPNAPCDTSIVQKDMPPMAGTAMKTVKAMLQNAMGATGPNYQMVATMRLRAFLELGSLYANANARTHPFYKMKACGGEDKNLVYCSGNGYTRGAVQAPFTMCTKAHTHRVKLIKLRSLQSTCDDLETQKKEIAEMKERNAELAKQKQQQKEVILAPKNSNKVTDLAGLAADLAAAKVEFTQIGTNYNAAKKTGLATDGAKVEEAYNKMVLAEKLFNERLALINPEFSGVFAELVSDISGETAAKKEAAIQEAKKLAADETARLDLERIGLSNKALQSERDALAQKLLELRVRTSALQGAHNKLKAAKTKAAVKPAGITITAPAGAPKRKLSPAQLAAAKRKAAAASAPGASTPAASQQSIVQAALDDLQSSVSDAVSAENLARANETTTE